jgi:hypothetical protein
MNRTDAIAQLQSLRQEAQARAYPRSRLAIQEYMDPGTAADDVVALGMAIRALQAPARRRMPLWACVLWCAAAAIIVAACVIYCL